MPSPRKSSVLLITSTNSLNSFGSKEALWSGPGRLLSKVMCFSITSAPREIALDETKNPREWSE